MRKSSNQKKKYFNAIILKIKINAKIIHDGKNTTIFNKERINISAVPYHHLRRWVKFCIQSKFLSPTVTPLPKHLPLIISFSLR